MSGREILTLLFLNLNPTGEYSVLGETWKASRKKRQVEKNGVEGETLCCPKELLDVYINL